jgi:hypothetical protein
MSTRTLRCLVYAGIIALFGSATFLLVGTATEVTGLTTTTIQNAQTTGNGTVIGPGYMPRCRESAIYIQWSAGTGAGGVTVETAHDPNYTGTWAPLATVAWAAASKEDVVQVTGIHAALRARISTTVTGGTVSVFATCN